MPDQPRSTESDPRSALAVPEPARRAAEWTVRGEATIDDRPPATSRLTICADGTWSAWVRTFTIADTVPYVLTAAAGGQFMGDAFVVRSGGGTHWPPGTELTGIAPLLIVAPSTVPEVEAADDMVDGEVVDITGAPAEQRILTEFREWRP